MSLDMYKRGYADGLIAAIIELERINSETFDATAKAALMAAKHKIAALQKARALNAEGGDNDSPTAKSNSNNRDHQMDKGGRAI